MIRDMLGVAIQPSDFIVLAQRAGNTSRLRYGIVLAADGKGPKVRLSGNGKDVRIFNLDNVMVVHKLCLPDEKTEPLLEYFWENFNHVDRTTGA